MKKLLAITLSLLMVFAVVPMAMISANAETKVGDSVKFYFGAVVVSNATGKPDVTANEILTIGNKTVASTSKVTYGTGGKVTDDGKTYSSYPWLQINGVTSGQYVEFTTPVNVDSGVYDVSFATRAATSGRSLLDVEINGNKVGTDIDTNNKAFSTPGYYSVPLSSVTLTSAGTLTVKVTGKSNGNMWLGNIILTKTADYSAPTTTSPISTDAKASIRLGAVNGIRFYSTIDEDAIAELNTENATVEYGTLIGPSDLVGDTLDIADVTAGNAVDVKFTADELYTEGDFSGIVGSIVDIKTKNIARDFSGCGYVKIGETYYYSTTTSVRSLKTVATAYANDGYPGATEAQKALVDGWKAAADYVG